MVTDTAILTLANMSGIILLQACLQQEKEEAENQSQSHTGAVSGCEQAADADADAGLSGCSVLSVAVEGAVAAATHDSVHHFYKWEHDGGHVVLSRGKKDTQQETREETEEEDGEVCRKEALKVLCNVIYNSTQAQERASALR